MLKFKAQKTSIVLKMHLIFLYGVKKQCVLQDLENIEFAGTVSRTEMCHPDVIGGK